MFPNQQSRDSWGSVAGYYGNYGMAGGLPPSMAGGPGANWYNWAQPGRSSSTAWPGAVPYPSGSSGQGEEERSMLSSMSGMERDVAEAMARERELMMRGTGEFGIYGNRGPGSKLGINTNIYSLYQNSQTKHGRPPHHPDVTISQIPSSHMSPPGYPEHHRPPSGDPRSDKDHIKPNYDATSRQPQASPGSYEAHLQKGPSQYSESGSHKNVGETRDSVDSNMSEKLFSACMQESGAAKQVGSTSGPAEPVEPDSSTDNPSESHKGSKESQEKDPLEKDNNGYIGVSDSEDEDDTMGEEQRQRLNIMKREQQAKMFNMKSDLDNGGERRKYFKSPTEDLVDLMKEANEKIFRGSGSHLERNSGHLPLSVEIQEMARHAGDPESVSPPRNLPGRFLPNSMISNNSSSSGISPRKRGRKPKHYSEILFELGQRGISITKTQKANQRLGSETGSVSHKTGGQQLKCPHCNKILTTSVGLMYHIRLHTGEKPYSCDLCGKSFATSSHYHYHIRSHSGEKPYRCDFCGKMYTASGSLRLHLKSHLSRLAANAFNTMNMPGFNLGGQNEGASMSRDPLQVGPADFKFGIKQEIFDTENNENSDAIESQHQRRDLENDRPNNNVIETNNNSFSSQPLH